ncbi:hypothetical protein D3C78_954860 [compost metagenome]
MLLLEQVLVLGAQVHDRLHVDFVVGRQHGHGRLGLDQTLGDLGAQAGHRHALLDAIASGEDRRVGGRSGRLDSRSGRSGLLGVDGSDGVFLGHATTLAGARNGVAVQVILGSDLARGRGQDRLGTGGSRSGGSGSRGSSGRSRSGSSGAPLGQLAEQLAAEHGVTLVLDDFGENAIGFGQNFHDHFVGFDVDNQLVTLDGVARLLVPGGDGTVSDGFRESRGFDLDSHYLRFLLIRVLQTCNCRTRGPAAHW